MTSILNFLQVSNKFYKSFGLKHNTLRYILRQNKKLALLYNHLIDYPTPIMLTYFGGFGSTAGIFLVIQLITGIFLAMHYCSDTLMAFNSVDHIMRDVNFGGLLRYMHANGASFFFLVVYIHIGRGLFYKSYMSGKYSVWLSGVIIYILMMATAFIGYVLPGGQMSFWGATVITNLFSVIPIFGNDVAYLIGGGFSVSNPTLMRFFSLHYLFPFLIVGVVIIHLIMLHEKGSSNPILGVSTFVGIDKISFYPYFLIKDFIGGLFIILIYCIYVFFFSNVLGHSDNYIEANAMITPTHIVPEWYFLPFYAILRSYPSKIIGVIMMALALVTLIILPFCARIILYVFYNYASNLLYFFGNYYSFPIKWVKNQYSIFFELGDFYVIGSFGSEIEAAYQLSNNYFFQKIIHIYFFLNFILLGGLGSQVVEDIYVLVGQISTIFYFFYFIVVIFGYQIAVCSIFFKGLLFYFLFLI